VVVRLLNDQHQTQAVRNACLESGAAFIRGALLRRESGPNLMHAPVLAKETSSSLLCEHGLLQALLPAAVHASDIIRSVHKLSMTEQHGSSDDRDIQTDCYFCCRGFVDASSHPPTVISSSHRLVLHAILLRALIWRMRAGGSQAFSNRIAS
jgi:hypothetical protein